jgi:hypothetical protein
MDRPNQAEAKYLIQAYNAFYDIFEEILTDSFWEKDKYYKFCKVKDAFSIYAELLNYPPLQQVIEYLKNNRPPMEAEIGSELFKFVRNVIAHFPFFGSWEEVWIDKDIVNWYKEGLSIDKFLRKYEGHEVVKYRFWEAKKKLMTYISISFPRDYTKGEQVFLREILSEKDGIKFSVIFMKRVIDTQVDDR